MTTIVLLLGIETETPVPTLNELNITTMTLIRTLSHRGTELGILTVISTPVKLPFY